jgi:acetate kinase
VDGGSILTVNVGSSSVKVALFDQAPDLVRRSRAEISNVGSPEAAMLVEFREEPPIARHVRAPDHAAAVEAAVDAVVPAADRPAAIIHRVVHGGPLKTPRWIDADLLASLQGLAPVASEHLPPALDAIAATAARFSGVRQAAAFDTAFHADLPDVARMYPLARRFAAAGVRRYGFHGLSCESVMDALGASSPADAAGRLVIAHLGNGCSLTAVRGGRSVETTMGFSPTGGVMMGTRTGDLDPGVLFFAMEHERLDLSSLRRLVTRESGLQGVSGRTRDMRALLAAETGDTAAREAIQLFCYTARKGLGALIAVLGGLDVLVFTGGIGEHAPAVRERIVGGLDDLGIVLDGDRNRANSGVVSREGARVTVRVVHSDEDRVLAAHARRLLGEASP